MVDSAQIEEVKLRYPVSMPVNMRVISSFAYRFDIVYTFLYLDQNHELPREETFGVVSDITQGQDDILDIWEDKDKIGEIIERSGALDYIQNNRTKLYGKDLAEEALTVHRINSGSLELSFRDKVLLVILALIILTALTGGTMSVSAIGIEASFEAGESLPEIVERLVDIF